MFNSDLMKRLSDCFGPSGREKRIREIIMDEIKNFADEITIDPLGNLIARKKGTGKKILFSAHMDQIGLIITHVDEKGFLRFANVGGLNAKELLGLRMVKWIFNCFIMKLLKIMVQQNLRVFMNMQICKYMYVFLF
jgi:putative aminopeptidase FrvX